MGSNIDDGVVFQGSMVFLGLYGSLSYHIKKTNSITLKKIFKRIAIKKNNHKLIVCSKVYKIFIKQNKVSV